MTPYVLAGSRSHTSIETVGLRFAFCRSPFTNVVYSMAIFSIAALPKAALCRYPPGAGAVRVQQPVASSASGGARSGMQSCPCRSGRVRYTVRYITAYSVLCTHELINKAVPLHSVSCAYHKYTLMWVPSVIAELNQHAPFASIHIASQYAPH